MNDRDPSEMLGRIVPFPTNADGSVEPSPAPPALFEEIVMTNPRTARRPVWARPATLVAAAAAATALVAGGVVLPDGSPSAYAEMVEAAESTLATATSGRMLIEVDLRETVDGYGTTSGTFVQQFTFSGDDWELVAQIDIVTSDTEFCTDDEDEADDCVSEGAIVTTTRHVDGVQYLRIDPDPSWVLVPGGDGSALEVLGLDDAGTDPNVALRVVEAAEDVIEVSSVGGVTTYSGTVSAAVLEAIEQLPAGLSMIASEPGNLPEFVDLTVEVVDGEVRSIRLDAVGPYPGTEGGDPGTVDASITTTFEQLGDDVVIEAPPADLVTDDLFLPGIDGGEPIEIDPEMQEATEVVFGYFEENPECLDLFLEDETGSDAGLLTCLDEAGASEVADAWRVMNE